VGVKITTERYVEHVTKKTVMLSDEQLLDVVLCSIMAYVLTDFQLNQNFTASLHFLHGLCINFTES